jgi:hypothetical protein
MTSHRRLTIDRELAALVEETETVRARATADEAGESTTKETGVGGDSVASVSSLVAAGECGLVTTLGLGLLDGHRLLDREADVAIVDVANTVTGAYAASLRAKAGKSNDGGCKGEDNGAQRELHFD